ncbi:hypothetical protein DVA67_003165 [Solirubrobacter sp. CPCC 204708]|uniref:Uncharacterized protein n=1 Tax=Solirubrobacter deserti TaxID=2282478 RepID=A0ABT4RNP4_9ACTN|nr:hypothetical protein [Solirubrobacter deserti]MBE2314958.1 hypothetical protein [Solirubrobacter deserti]MDA0140190.1 hypothetical protein [Solirubrobacter deserti]
MADYLLVPAEPTSWVMGVDGFERRLLAAVPAASIWRSEDSESPALLRFHVPWSEAGFTDGHLMRDRQTVELNGGLDEAAVFALWLRSIVPVEQDLLLVDEGCHFAVVVREGTTNADILDAALTAAERLADPSRG